ncbi:MAG: response regulator [Lachnospiraceae bacterium]|nr:response regulator [Lachnospiraceae bacterium]
MLTNKKLVILCFLQYIVVLLYHIIYSLINCTANQTRLISVWSVCMLVVLGILGNLFINRTEIIVYITMASVLFTVSYVGYILHTLAMGILIFFMAGIILAMFLKKSYVLIWWLMSVGAGITYSVLWPDIILEIIPSLFLYYGYIIVYIIGGINLYIMVRAAGESFDKLRNRTETSEKESALKNIFWANISNEIRTPMNVINGMSSLLKTENLNVRAREYTDQIENASGMLLNIVNDTLELANIESGLYTSTETTYDIYSEAHYSVMIASNYIHDEKINLLYCINPAVPAALFGDGSLIRECLVKLLVDTVLFSNRGEVKLDIDMDQPKSNDEEIFLNIKISGSDTNIKDQTFEDLFSGFDSSESTRTTEQESIGLSLKLCKAMIELMGGKIDFQKTGTNGVEFSVFLVQAVSSEKELIRKLEEGRDSKNKGWIAPQSKVLVVDDTPTNLKLISGMIRLHGIDPDNALSGREALAMMENKKYDLIFLDYMMPDMNGVETFKQIMSRDASPNFKDIPIIALTSKSLQRDRGRFMDMGFAEFISKPIDDRELESLLKMFLLKEGEDEDTGEP